MTRVLLALTLLSVVLVSCVTGDDWALLVAGSDGWINYRHQADICHAYHILHNHGIPDERIVVMMFDDIAYNENNPVQGEIINEFDGPNLYPGVLKDYTGPDVTPEVFLKVLSGDEEGVEKLIGRKGKVIKSGPNDNVFVDFSDHGAPGLIAFPSGHLFANDLNDTLVKMYTNNQYKEMVIYIEACESGSMFHNILRTDINIYAATAANPYEPSHGTYFDEKRDTYLGDLFSVNWMQNSDSENLGNETLLQQFKITQKNTLPQNHVTAYGDLSIQKKMVGDFQGNNSNAATLFFRRENKSDPNIGAVPSRDVPLEILKRKLESATGLEKLQQQSAILNLLKKKDDTRIFFKNIVDSVINIEDYDDILNRRVRFTDFTCYKEGIGMINAMCPGIQITKNDYALRNLNALANLCEAKVPKEMVWTAIKKMIATSLIC